MATAVPARREEPDPSRHEPERLDLETAVVRFAGDSGDGMQLTGSQFTQSVAVAGYDLATFPDFPAEIRAPAGTTFGVSAFQIQFGTQAKTSGDSPDMLVAMNPAALKVELHGLKPGGIMVFTCNLKNDITNTPPGERAVELIRNIIGVPDPGIPDVWNVVQIGCNDAEHCKIRVKLFHR